MEVRQIYELVNDVTKEVLGDSVVVNEDLSNVVDVGTAIYNNNSFDKYSNTLIDKIGKVVFVNRVWKGSAPNVLKTGWEYGSVLQKIHTLLPEATENEDWELVQGQSYDPNVFNGATFVSKFYNKYVTFEIDRSITEKQLKSAFTSAEQLNGLVSMIFNEISKSMQIKMDGLVYSTIASFIADTIVNEYGDNPSSATLAATSGVRAINLLKLYNTEYSKTLTKAKCLSDPDFLRYACYIMSLYVDRLASCNTIYNLGGTVKFTPKEELHVVMLSEFEKASQVFLQSDTFHDSLIALPRHTSIPYLQGNGGTYAFASTSKVDVKSGNGKTLATDGILAVMFDNEALGISNVEDKVTTQYNPKAEFSNYFYKRKLGCFNDGNEQFVVFFVQ